MVNDSSSVFSASIPTIRFRDLPWWSRLLHGLKFLSKAFSAIATRRSLEPKYSYHIYNSQSNAIGISAGDIRYRGTQGDIDRVRRYILFLEDRRFHAHPRGAECDCEVRMLAPSSGMSEDPITGSLNSAIAHWMQAEGRLPGPVTIAQGTAIGRRGRVSIRPGKDKGSILIGGQTHILVRGTVAL